MDIEIYNWNDLAKIGNDPDYPIPSAEDEEEESINYYLMNNLNQDTEGYDVHASSEANDGAGWLPIGRNSDGSINDFYCNFYGQKHNIQGLYINRPDIGYLGVFAILGVGYKIVQLGVVDCYINGKNRCGSIVGVNELYGYIKQCYARGGSINGENAIGGIIGGDEGGNIINSYSAVEV
ncbi:MAG: hypothetical protein ACOCRK_10225, partial [bacterium]